MNLQFSICPWNFMETKTIYKESFKVSSKALNSNFKAKNLIFQSNKKNTKEEVFFPSFGYHKSKRWYIYILIYSLPYVYSMDPNEITIWNQVHSYVYFCFSRKFWGFSSSSLLFQERSTKTTFIHFSPLLRACKCPFNY